MSIAGLSNTHRLQSNSLKNIANGNMPNWGKIPHKGMECPSDQEFQTIIDDLGKALAKAKGNKDDAEYQALWNKIEETYLPQYISSVSPDRKALVNEAMPFANLFVQNQNSSKNTAAAPLTLLDYLNMNDGILTSTNKGRFQINLNSGGTITFTGSDLQPDTFDIRSSENGVPIIGRANGNWAITHTPAEQARRNEFLSKLRAAENVNHFSFSNEHSNNAMLDMKI